jgi:DNA-binding NarL/FixJ family response regulator
MNKIRVVLADDHSLVRAGFRAMLESLSGVEVVAEANDGRQALQFVEQHKPDIVFMDIAMPGLNGLEAARRVKRISSQIRVVMLSMHTTEEYVMQAIQAGAAGYLLKGADPSELEIALRAVARGETYLSPGVSKHVIDDYLRRTSGSHSEKEEIALSSRLTPRQREVLQLIAEGNTTKEIARILHISPKTVESHRQGIMDRVDIHDLAGLVRYAIRIGLVTPE